jgi:plasmid stability protein
MPQILVRNLGKQTVDRLKRKARSEGRSLQAEAKSILEQAALSDPGSARRLADKVGLLFRGRKMADSVALLRESRER